MDRILKAVKFYRDKNDVLNPYILQLIQFESEIIEESSRFFLQIITPELSLPHEISFEVNSAVSAEKEFERTVAIMRSMIQPEYEEREYRGDNDGTRKPPMDIQKRI